MMPKNQPINEQKLAISAASVGQCTNITLLTELSTWAVSLKFIFEQGINLICLFEHFGKLCKTSFSVFIKNRGNVTPKYEYIIIPHASSIRVHGVICSIILASK